MDMKAAKEGERWQEADMYVVDLTARLLPYQALGAD